MADEVAGGGAGSAVGTSASWTGGGLAHACVQVLNSPQSAARACRDCGGPLPPPGTIPGSPRVRCLACQPPRTTARTSRPCIGCGGDVGPLAARGRMRVRCRPCRARASRDRGRRRHAQSPRWNRPRPCRFCGEEFRPRLRTDNRRRACYSCGLTPYRRWPCVNCGAACTRRDGRCRSCETASRARRACGTTYVPKSVERTSFCSRDCAHAFQREHRQDPEADLASQREAAAQRSCNVCGRSFTPRHGSRTCSERCHTSRASCALPRETRFCAECGAAFAAPAGPRARSCAQRCGT